MLKKLTIVLGMAVAVAGMTTVSSFVFVPEAHAWGYKNIKKAAKKVGSKANKGRKYIQRKAKKGTKVVARGAKRATPYIKRSCIRPSYSPGDIVRCGKLAGRTAKRGYEGAKRAGRHTKKAVRSYYKCTTRGCGRIGDLPAGTKGNHDHRN